MSAMESAADHMIQINVGLGAQVGNEYVIGANCHQMTRERLPGGQRDIDGFASVFSFQESVAHGAPAPERCSSRLLFGGEYRIELVPKGARDFHEIGVSKRIHEPPSRLR